MSKSGSVKSRNYSIAAAGIMAPMLTVAPLSEFDFHHHLSQSEGTVLVMFSAPGCGACRTLEKLLPGVLDGMASGLFKVDAQQDMGLARAYEVFHLPALFLFLDGHYHARIESEATPPKMKAALEAALAAPAQDEP